MNLRETLHIDRQQNQHPKNRMFLWVYRHAQYFYQKQSKMLAWPYRIILRLTYNRNNHWPIQCSIGSGLRLPHNMGIVISGKAKIGAYCTIFHQVTIGEENGKAPTIGNHVLIGAGAKILGDVHIGDYVKVGANAIVTKDVREGLTVVGVNQVIVHNLK